MARSAATARTRNAYADPVANLSDGPDGTIYLGIGLLTRYRDEWLQAAAKVPEPLAQDRLPPQIRIIIAHEFAHIHQYKLGLSPEGPWQMEPHADFMAGWAVAPHLPQSEMKLFGRAEYFSRPYGHNPGIPWKAEQLGADWIHVGAETMFGLGDVLFNFTPDHGQPHFRAVMVRAGYESYELQKLDLKGYFCKGVEVGGAFLLRGAVV